MEYVFTTTDEQEKALTYYAARKGQPPAELLSYIVSVEMDRFVTGYREVDKQKLADVYKKAEQADKDIIDAIIAKVAAAEAGPVEP